MVKRAHMIPRGYLTAWTNDRGMLFVTDKENAMSREMSLSSATVVRYVYEAPATVIDLEHEFSRIESRGIPAIRRLAGDDDLNREGKLALVQFLDMFAKRSLGADQTKVRPPMVKLKMGSMDAELGQFTLGDRLVLSDAFGGDGPTLQERGFQSGRWCVTDVPDGLITGDGAVIEWQISSEAVSRVVTFPLSPTRLLVMGQGGDTRELNVNRAVLDRSRRWLIDRLEGPLARAENSR